MCDLLSSCESAEVVIKITERCNINCTYCYMFNKGNEDYSFRPPILKKPIYKQIITFIEEGVSDLGIQKVNVVLHGGEPLMMGKRRFTEFCQNLVDALAPKVSLSIGIQTNGTLIDYEWTEIFARFNIQVGVSLDGPREINDRFRIDKKGQGTYESTLRGIKVLQDAYNQGTIIRPGIICVIDPTVSAKKVYRHFIDDLGFRSISFNLPMETVDSAPPEFGKQCGLYLSELFSEWVRDADPQINIRIFDQLLRFFSGESYIQDLLPNRATRHLMVIIASDGELSEHDDFKVINFAQREGTVFDTSMFEFANSDLRKYLHHVSYALPDECQRCDWRKYCRGGVTHGLTVSRYSESNGFNNRSALCDGFAALFEQGANFVLNNGLPPEVLARSLGLDNESTNTFDALQDIPSDLMPKSLTSSFG